MNEKILCIYCGELAEIVSDGRNQMVACKNCNRDTMFIKYKKLLDDWLNAVRKNNLA